MHQRRTRWPGLLLRWLLWGGALLCCAELVARLCGTVPAYLHAGRVRRNLEQCRAWPLAAQDGMVVQCTNSWGLVGPLPASGARRIIALGSSTTECPFMTAEDTWPVLLQRALEQEGHPVWVGNGGVNGSTTLGNAIYLEDYLLSLGPELMLFMPGANDRRPIHPNRDAGLLEPDDASWAQRVLDHSRVLAWLARRRMVIGRAVPSMPGSPPRIPTTQVGSDVMHQHRTRQADYRDRVLHVVDTCLSRGVLPVLMTQPMLASDSSASWVIMDLYNATVRSIALERAVPLLDLAHELPRRRAYYLDGMHFSPEGTKAVSVVLLPRMVELLSRPPARTGAAPLR